MRQSKLLTPVITLALLAAMVVGCGGGPKSVTFPDEILEAAIRDALGKTTGEEITAVELAELIVLDATESGIANLSGLEYCTSLMELYLSGNPISDISPLANLTSLTLLILDWNQISDITPLVENSGLGAGDKVYFKDNNLDLGDGSKDMENIRALEDRGVLVQY